MIEEAESDTEWRLIIVNIIKKIAVLDIIPTFDAFNLSNKEFSSGYYHWYFLSQPSPLPEKLINADPDFSGNRTQTELRKNFLMKKL